MALALTAQEHPTPPLEKRGGACFLLSLFKGEAGAAFHQW